MGREYVESKYVKTLDKVGELLQQVDAMKKTEAQMKTREQIAIQSTFYDAAAINEYAVREQLLEARIQTLTEDNDILRKENDLNNGWVDNQQGLAEALQKVSLEKEVLEERVKQLEQTLQTNARKYGGVIAAKKAATSDNSAQRLHFNQGSYNQFFNLSPTPNSENQK